MADTDQFVRALNALEKVYTDLADISLRSDEDRKQDLINLRRSLAQCIADIAKLGDPLFAAQPDADMLRTFRSKLSRMRSGAAIHQAKWPAVRLGESVDEYKKSVTAVREANHDFMSWARAAVGGMA